MEENKNIFIVIKSDSEKTKIIIKNIIIMLKNRIYIDKSGNKQPLLSDRFNGLFFFGKYVNNTNFSHKLEH